VFPTSLIRFMHSNQQSLCSLLKILIHVKVNICVISFILASMLALIENFTLHLDFMNTFSSILQPYPLGVRIGKNSNLLSTGFILFCLVIY
jgi:hypothetical protein